MILLETELDPGLQRFQKQSSAPEGFMPSEYNIYCDESCHLENDGEPFMVLGAIQCPKDRARYFAEEIRNIKIRHNLNSNLEIKWTKVSKSKVEFYTDLIKLFFASNELKFRGVIADKTVLQHSVFHQTHTEWYYKIYFNLLKKEGNNIQSVHIQSLCCC